VYVQRRADGKCEGCLAPAPFKTKKRRPYLEPHHTTRLSDGGPDHPRHVIALCPTCHRRVHHGEDGDDYNDALKATLRAIE
jgi:5-methylcytosine-specific restriction protein A